MNCEPQGSGSDGTLQLNASSCIGNYDGTFFPLAPPTSDWHGGVLVPCVKLPESAGAEECSASACVCTSNRFDAATVHFHTLPLPPVQRNRAVHTLDAFRSFIHSHSGFQPCLAGDPSCVCQRQTSTPSIRPLFSLSPLTSWVHLTTCYSVAFCLFAFRFPTPHISTPTPRLPTHLPGIGRDGNDGTRKN